MSPWNQEPTSPDQVLGPKDPFGEILQPIQAEGRLIGVLGAKPPGIWGPYGPFWGSSQSAVKALKEVALQRLQQASTSHSCKVSAAAAASFGSKP